MNDNRETLAKPTLDYATPRDDGSPRPTALLWVAAALVWAASVPPALLWTLLAIGSIARDPVMTPVGLGLATLAAGVAWAEWAALRGSIGANALICILSIPVALIGTIAAIGTIIAGLPHAAARPGDWLLLVAVSAVISAVPLTVAIAHARWSARLHEFADRRRYDEPERQASVGAGRRA